jgi:hypothetical protein
MDEKLYRGLAVLTLLALGGCGTFAGGDQVRVITSEHLAKDCQYLTQVDSGYATVFQGGAPQGALNILRRRAFQAGGNAVVIVYNTRTYHTMNMVGDVYRCDDETVHRPNKPILPGQATPIDPKRLLGPAPGDTPGRTVAEPPLPGPATRIDPARLGGRTPDQTPP